MKILFSEAVQPPEQKAAVHIDASLRVAKRNVVVFNKQKHPVPGGMIQTQTIQNRFSHAG